MSKLSQSLGGICAAAMLLLGSNAYAGAVEGFKVIEKQNCAACHNLTGQINAQTVALWRKGPDLYYAGDRYNQDWIEKWLQHPKHVRPAGVDYMTHVQTGKKWDIVRKDSLKDHMALNAKDAKNVASALAELRSKSALLKAENYDPDASFGAMGDMMFDKVNGCMACHSIEPGYGGLSGPELYTAAERLKPEYMLSYIRDPQAWNHRTWMPKRVLSEEDMQKMVNYIISLSADSKKVVEKHHTSKSAAQNYRFYCMQCHGIAGKGAGVNARDMAVPPRNHSQGKYLQAKTDAELFKAIKEGGLSINKSALMPPWGGTLSDIEIKGLVKHIRKLCRCKFDGAKEHH